jgi:exosortase A
MSTLPLSPAWRRTLPLLAALIGWILFCYRDTALAMVSIWARSDTYAHAFVVPPIVLWLIWRQRADVLAEQPRASLLLAIPVVATTFAWLLGELTSVNALTQFALVATLVFSVLALLGTAVSKRIAFPLAFLFFAVPVGDFMLPLLMEWTARFTVGALRASGIPVYQEGLQFVIPSGNWSVVEACSGIRYIIASLTVGTLFAYLNYFSWRRRVVFIAASLIVPVFANWLRAYMIVMLGHLSGNRLAAGVDHLIYGWIFFGFVIITMFMVGARWRESPAPAAGGPLLLTADIPANTGRSWLPALGIAVLAAAGPHIFLAISNTDQVPPPSLARFVAPEGWSETTAFSNWKPVYERPATELQTAFSRSGQNVGLYIAYYRSQDYQSKLITSTNTLARSTDQNWAVVSERQSAADFDGLPASVRTAELRGKDGVDTRLAVWQWYWINGHLSTSDFEAKLYTALSRLRGDGDDSAVVILYAPRATADVTLPAFARQGGRAIADMLATTSAAR